ncbi:MAG TPA: Chromate resistance protein ChrB [Amycolatopsis sp.]|nr:Chromate resistance protein ChrB [Amycolatopsis sp.]
MKRPNNPGVTTSMPVPNAAGPAGTSRRPTVHMTPSTTGVTTGNVIAATFVLVIERDAARWLVLVVRVPAEPSRHRVAVWRELRRIGALSLGQGAWVVPDVPVFADGVTRVIELALRGEGEVLVLDAAGRAGSDAARLEALFTAERADEWAEFLADCGKFDAEIDKEIRNRKFTLAELEEEEQSLDRLRRWYRDIMARDVFGAPAAAEAEQRLKHCADRLADYTEQVFQALHQM